MGIVVLWAMIGVDAQGIPNDHLLGLSDNPLF